MDIVYKPNGVLPNERWRNKNNGNIYNPEGELWFRPYELFLIKFEKEQETYFAQT